MNNNSYGGKMFPGNRILAAEKGRRSCERASDESLEPSMKYSRGPSERKENWDKSLRYAEEK